MWAARTTTDHNFRDRFTLLEPLLSLHDPPPPQSSPAPRRAWPPHARSHPLQIRSMSRSYPSVRSCGVEGSQMQLGPACPSQRGRARLFGHGASEDIRGLSPLLAATNMGIINCLLPRICALHCPAWYGLLLDVEVTWGSHLY